MKDKDQTEMPISASTVGESVSLAPLLGNAQFVSIITYFLPIAVLVGFLGLLTNIANVITFFRMGLTTTNNINFFALSIADLFCAAYTTSCLVLLHPFVDDVVWNFSLLSMMTVVHILYLCASAFGSWVTAVICVQRFCCIVYPMKVKSQSRR
ncbi:chemosensory receptor B [Elysia marginata]|uniref:Chemosensory receptor B n=1 Tax=Elysia marginata TaxID=1093978 RepID=A0AAV4IH65_9GAST|nr:chemosensory receptor B [Elysia marginata]